MFQLEVFIREFSAIDRLASHSIVMGEIASLNHELRDNSMEVGVLVGHDLIAHSAGLIPFAKMEEVGRGLRNGVIVELEDQTAFLLSIDAHIEKYFGVLRR